mgnify:CR=1 FL=1
MTLYYVSHIEWDTDGEKVDIPDSVYVRVNDDEELSDALSDHFGFCHFGFNYERIED